MARKNKLRKFAEIRSFSNVFECYDPTQPVLVGKDMEPVDLKGRWREAHFRNDNPITLELACGAGEYTNGLARLFPDRNFIGVDVKGNRLHGGAREAVLEGIPNAAFLRTRIEVIDHFFAPGEVAEIWITFCDPFPRAIKENRRLTSPFFHEKFRHFLQPGGLMHLKHDSDDFVKYSLESIGNDPQAALLYQNLDIYAGEMPMPELSIKTLYEGKHLDAGKTIKYLRYTIG